MEAILRLVAMLKGRKTLVGSLLLSLLGAFWSLDLLSHNGHPVWVSDHVYASLGTTIAGLTGAAMRLAIGKAETKNGEK